MDGSGKSTQAKLLYHWLRAKGLPVYHTEWNSSTIVKEATKIGKSTRRLLPITFHLVHAADFADRWARQIEPVLEIDGIVICDRYMDSTIAYQGYGHDLGRAVIDELHRLVLGYFQPDLTVILDIPVAEGLARATNRERAEGSREDRYEHMDEGFHQRLRDGFLDIARRNPERCVVIDAAQEPDKVQAEIRAVVGQRLKVAWA